MRVIQEQIKMLPSILGKQEIDGQKTYRPISFCILTDTDGQFIAYNSLTGEIVEVSGAEAEILKKETLSVCEDAKQLIEKWYLVPCEHDDIELANEILAFVKVFEKKDGIKSYTIFTTMDCNARCFYCYEMGRPRTPMSLETARDVVDFICKNAPANKKVKLNWFGGEPLYNAEVIDIITSGLRAESIEFTSTMVSNGFLFDDVLIEKAVKDWRLQRVQITLDGTEEVYNRSKAYIDAEEKNPFLIVTENIEKLLKNNISVSIRLNMGSHNKRDLEELIEWIAVRYSGYKNLNAYAHLLFEYDDNTVKEEFRLSLAEDMLALEARLRDLGLAGGGRVKLAVSSNRCMADADFAVTITPTGKLGKCEHYSENEFVGTIYEGITSKEKTEEFKERSNTKERCVGCSAYPVCIRLKKCPDNGNTLCNSATQMLEEKRLEIRAQSTYKKLKEQQKNKAE